MTAPQTPDPNKPTILLAVTADGALASLRELFQGHYRLRVVLAEEQVLESACDVPFPDLIVLDSEWAGQDAFVLCEQIGHDRRTRGIPVLMLVPRHAADDEEKAFAMGAADCIATPVSAAAVLTRLKTQLAHKAAADFLHDKNAFLEAEVARQTRDHHAAHDVTMLAMATLAEYGDAGARNHTRRIQHYVRALAWKLSSHARFRDTLTVPVVSMLFRASALHDIGKAGIPDAILLKKGRLTPEEFEVMKAHTTIGRDALTQAQAALGLDAPFLVMARQIVLSHQEKWDGTGYPEGLAGEQIPVVARIVALADVYDALISRRDYKEAMPHDEAVRIIESSSGQHFDPDIVAAFMQIHEQLYAVALTYMNTPADGSRKAQ
jgi:putative two-component system response regulator